jgi:BirA family transcriptional regulator, biotin operon repressor / biotin---[acetyl-CoA-carboxylase] ligase
MSDLSTLFTGRKLIKLRIVDSTNRQLFKLFSEKNAAEGTAVLADCQSAGQGMGGNHWHSEYGKNLLLSILFTPHFLPAKNIAVFNKTIAVAVHQFLSTVIKHRWSVTIKWPNDIYVDDKKICGIKIECSTRGHNLMSAVVGIGLNVNQTQFPSDLFNPVSIKQLTRKEFSVEDCFNGLCNEIEKQYLRLKAGHEKEISRDYLNAMYRKDKMSQFEDDAGRFQGVIKDVDDEGRLCIENTNGGLLKYAMKDVKFII